MESNNGNTIAKELKAMMMDEEAIKRNLEVPTQAMNLAIETGKKMQDVSLDYYRQIERIQRDHWQGMSKLAGTMLPGESKLWDVQTKLVESGFDMLDRLMAVGKKA